MILFKWYSKSADQGLAGAKYNLGILYDEGQGVPRLSPKATQLKRVLSSEFLKTADLEEANALGARLQQLVRLP